MSKLAFVLIGVACSAFGCDDDDIFVDVDGVDEPLPPDGVVTPVAPEVFEWRATLVDIDTSTNISGDALVVQVDGEAQFDASLSISNDSSTCHRPWHVHVGTCATGGDIVGDGALYPLLVVGTDGTASAEALVPVALDPGQDYHVNVHYSESQFDRIIACGDLVLQ